MNIFRRFRNFIATRVFAVIFILGITVSFPHEAKEPSHDPRALKFPLQGRVADGRYYGLEDYFSIAMPMNSSTAELDEFFTDPINGGITFFNSSGFLLKLEMGEVAPEVSFLIKNHPEVEGEILDAIFSEAFLPQHKIVIPKLSILHKTIVKLSDNHEALFTVLDMPEAATVIDLNTGRHLDSKRGYLLFLANDRNEVVNLSLQDTLTLIPTVAEAAKARLHERLLNHLLQYQSTFRWEKK